MTHPTTTALLARLLNTLPPWPWLAWLAPRPVLIEAMAQLQTSEARTIRLARVDLVLQEIREGVDQLEQEAGR